jgi:carboxymethylenebutenolidase
MPPKESFVDVRTEDVEITTTGGSIPAFLAEPNAEPLGGLAIVQEAFGVTPHIKNVARRFAEAGWLAIAPSFYHRQGSPAFMYDEPVAEVFRTLTADGVIADLTASFAYLRVRGFPASRTGVVGYCLGGTLATYAAAHGTFAAAVSYYGSGLTDGRYGLAPLVDVAPSFNTPWLGFFGDLDSVIPSADVEVLRSAAKRASVPTAVVRYAQAGHAFNNEDRPEAFNAAASADAWKQTTYWLARHLRS